MEPGLRAPSPAQIHSRGAFRRLKRVIQQRLQNELANAILGCEFPEGSTIRVESQNGEFAFRAV